MSKLTAEIVAQIRTRYADGGMIYRELATEYNVGVETIARVIRRESWT